jgi:hypothetical protein
MTQDERAIRGLLDEFTRALCAKDPTGAIAPLADDAVTFDLDPPLQHGPDVTHDPARQEEWLLPGQDRLFRSPASGPSSWTRI